LRSGPYCTEIAKIVQAPILHEWADPEAVVHVSRIATEFRQHFKRDITTCSATVARPQRV
jgi:2-oxoglutarate dehydrogenase E1 component